MVYNKGWYFKIMKILQFIHSNYIKAKKFLYVQDKILLLVLCLMTGSFVMILKTPVASANGMPEKPVINIQGEETNGNNGQENIIPDDNKDNNQEVTDPDNNWNTGQGNINPDTNKDTGQETVNPGNNGDNSQENINPDTSKDNGQEAANLGNNGNNNQEIINPDDNGQENKDSNKDALKGKWKTKNNKTFYYKNGKKIKGLQKIRTQHYYFDSKGVQRTGWQKYKENYYFFYIFNGKKRIYGQVKKGEWNSFRKKRKSKTDRNKQEKTGSPGKIKQNC